MVKQPLRELRRGDVFRTADGRLWWLYAHGQPPYGQSWASGVGREEDTFPLPPDESVEPLDLPALLARLKGLERENDFLRGQLSDLWQDRTGAAVGAEAERGAVLRLFLDAQGRGQTWAAAVALSNLEAEVKRRGPCRPPVPPHRLEGALRDVAETLQGWHEGRHPVWDVGALLARVREALGEGS